MSDDYILMAADYRVMQGEPVIHLFSRNHGGKEEMTVSTRPYFYAPWEECQEDGAEGPYESVNHEKVGKIYTTLPREVSQLSKNYTRPHEDKILFPLRWLIDKGIKAPFEVKMDGTCIPIEDFHCPMTWVNVDAEIEVTKKPSGNWSTIQDAMAGRQMFLSLCYEFSNGDRFTDTADNELDERRMLDNYIKMVQKYNIDSFLGWNISFDLTCIINRCRRHKINANCLSPMHYVDIRERDVHVAGRNVLDLREGFRKYFQGRTFASYTLEDIADEFLGIPPDDFDYRTYMNRNHIKMIKEYNQRDVDRAVGVDKKLDILNHFDGVRKVAGCRLVDALQTSKYADAATLRKYHNRYVLGTRGKKKKEEVEGAEVLVPKRGVHKNVVMVDFAGMYPSIILSNNISPECLTRIPDDAFDIDGVYFTKKPRGVIPETVEEFVSHRSRIKKEMRKYETSHPLYKMLDLRQYSIKQMIAAIYGYFAYTGSRLYYPQIARSITFMGRKYILQTVKQMKEHGYATLYGDTDSLMIQVKGDLEEEGKQIEVMINDFWQKEAEKIGMYMPPVIEFEIGYSQVLLSAKKRYAGRCTYYKGKPADDIIIKGFEARRSDAATISRRVQTDILNMILNERPEGEIREYIRNVDITQLPFEEIGIPDPLRKDPEHYKGGAKAGIYHVFYANEFMGKNFYADSRPYVFWINRVKPGMPTHITLEVKGKRKSYKVKRVALENEQDLQEWWDYIDWETQAEKVIENKLEPILSAYGITMGEIQSGQKQEKLGVSFG